VPDSIEVVKCVRGAYSYPACHQEVTGSHPGGFGPLDDLYKKSHACRIGSVLQVIGLLQ
jgi:hypothetical protein